MKQYKGTFNWYGEIIVLHTSSTNIDSAYQRLTRVLAKRVQRTPAAVRGHLASGHRYEIEESRDGK